MGSMLGDSNLNGSPGIRILKNYGVKLTSNQVENRDPKQSWRLKVPLTSDWVWCFVLFCFFPKMEGEKRLWGSSAKI